MRLERLLSRLRRFINAMDATIVRSSSARTLFVSFVSEWFFRSSFIGNLFRISLVLQARDIGARRKSKALQCGCNVADINRKATRNDIAGAQYDAVSTLRYSE